MTIAIIVASVILAIVVAVLVYAFWPWRDK